jgi:hypothetical protein
MKEELYLQTFVMGGLIGWKHYVEIYKSWFIHTRLLNWSIKPLNTGKSEHRTISPHDFIILIHNASCTVLLPYVESHIIKEFWSDHFWRSYFPFWHIMFRTISPHDFSGSHKEAGLGNGFSKATPPVNKNLHSLSSTWFWGLSYILVINEGEIYV